VGEVEEDVMTCAVAVTVVALVTVTAMVASSYEIPK